MTDTAEQLMSDDLARSGLKPEDLDARIITTLERGTCSVSFNTNGYAIPYFNLKGEREQFYRLRIFDNEIKYKQPKNTENHLYYPKNFMAALKASKRKWVFLTEGEKKAVAATNAGFPCVAVGGVDSWKSTTVVLPKEVEQTIKDDKILIKLPDDFGEGKFTSKTCKGLDDFVELVQRNELTLFICYDSDQPGGLKHQVQRAAAALGFHFRFAGIPLKQIRQLVLPFQAPKIGIDDFIQDFGEGDLMKLIQQNLLQRTAFPVYPDFRNYLQKQLQSGRIDRKKAIELSTMIICQLDGQGIRMFGDDGLPKYFDVATKTLMPVSFPESNDPDYSQKEFAKYMYKKFGLGVNDIRTLGWVNTMFMTEEPVARGSVHRVVARLSEIDDSVIYQLSDSQYAVITADGLEIRDNGSRGILFVSNQVERVDGAAVKRAYDELMQQPVKAWWAEVLAECRLKDFDRDLKMMTLLYYTSPFLYRWRGTQLPIEMVLGEAGSGKSTICTLRLNILTGLAKLRNIPNDIKDWQASIANAGGLHITDNVQLGSKELRQRLSDELCRLVTEPIPTIEMRKYFTNVDQLSIPVRAVFALTAIQQPFQNSDILQRSIILQLDKARSVTEGGLKYDSQWMQRHMAKFGGREFWLAHHFVVLTKFFQLVKKEWDDNYQADHRLINMEQIFRLLSKVLGLDTEDWLKDYLNYSTAEAVHAADWTFEGLAAYVDYTRKATPQGKVCTFTCSQVADWAAANEEFQRSEVLSNARRLGRYMSTHKAQLMIMLGIREAGIVNNRQSFQIVEVPKKPS